MESQEITSNDTRAVLRVRTNVLAMFLLSLVMFFVAVNVVLALDWALPRWEIDFHINKLDRWMFLGSLVLLVVVHEALHAFAAMQWGDVPFSSIQFGLKWKWLVPYCHCASPLRIGVYRIFVLLPLMVTTPVAGLVLWFAPSFWSLLLFSIAFSACAGDVLMYFKVQDFRSDLWVEDHPSEPGCYIWPEGQSPPK